MKKTTDKLAQYAGGQALIEYLILLCAVMLIAVEMSGMYSGKYAIEYIKAWEAVLIHPCDEE